MNVTTDHARVTKIPSTPTERSTYAEMLATFNASAPKNTVSKYETISSMSSSWLVFEKVISFSLYETIPLK